MKSFVFPLIFLFFYCLSTYSQDRHLPKKLDIEDFNKRKAEYIISEVKLTPKEIAQFIPLMNELHQKRFDLNRKVRRQGRDLENSKNISDKDYQSFIELFLNSNIEEAELNKEYYQKFRLILSSEQIYRYQVADREFMKNFVNKHRHK